MSFGDGNLHERCEHLQRLLDECFVILSEKDAKLAEKDNEVFRLNMLCKAHSHLEHSMLNEMDAIDGDIFCRDYYERTIKELEGEL